MKLDLYKRKLNYAEVPEFLLRTCHYANLISYVIRYLNNK